MRLMFKYRFAWLSLLIALAGIAAAAERHPITHEDLGLMKRV